MTRALRMAWLMLGVSFAAGGEGMAAAEIEGMWTGATNRTCGSGDILGRLRGKFEINVAGKVVSGYFYSQKSGRKYEISGDIIPDNRISASIRGLNIWSRTPYVWGYVTESSIDGGLGFNKGISCGFLLARSAGPTKAAPAAPIQEASPGDPVPSSPAAVPAKPPTSAPATVPALQEQLAVLKGLLDNGLISAQDYETRKRALLDRFIAESMSFGLATAQDPPRPTVGAQPAAKLGIDFGRYHALVIGNNNYARVPKLKTARTDAVAVSEALKRLYGFEVELLLDATRYDILKSLSKLRARLTERDNLLIYYAGHGIIDNETDEGYWLPVDAEPDIVANWISTSTLTNMVKAMSAEHVLVVADSCYSGTLVRTALADLKTGAERSAWLERMSRKRSRTAITSGGLEPVMDRGGGDNSVFAKAFLDALYENDEIMDAQSLFATIQRRVVVNSDQTPQYSDIRGAGHDGGDFLFVRR